MSRRPRLFESVMSLPWPVGVAMAVSVFLAYHLFLIAIPQTPVATALASGVKMLAYFFFWLLLAASLFSFITQTLRRRRLRATRGLADIRSLSWRQFEAFVGEVFRSQGYFVLETPEGPDNGVDLVLRSGGEKTYVQCKHWKTNTIGVEKVRELLGSMSAGGAQAGIFVTSGNYTRPARAFARECAIELIDGDRLAKLLEPLQNTAQPQAQSDESGMSCPLCAAEMVRRVARRGHNKGKAFWGCSTYPQCRGIRNE